MGTSNMQEQDASIEEVDMEDEGDATAGPSNEPQMKRCPVPDSLTILLYPRPQVLHKRPEGYVIDNES